MLTKKNLLFLLYVIIVLAAVICALIFAYEPVRLYVIFPLNILLAVVGILVLLELYSGLIYVGRKNREEARLKSMRSKTAETLKDSLPSGLELNAPNPNCIKIAMDKDCPSIACIIAAYLPNEEEIIEETVLHLLQNVYFPSSCKHKIILAYNTPKDMPEIEKRLRDIQSQNSSRFICVRVMQSTSKAHNVNYVLENILIGDEEPDVCAIYDADHKPAEDAIGRALRHFQNDPELDVLQGRCVVTNGHESWMSYIVGAEFDFLYGICHTGRSLVYNFAIFGGTNGYWKCKVLREIEFKTDMLTEDVDASMRSVQLNKKTKYDHRIESRELAPVTFSSFMKQRSRWAQGWFQVTVKRFANVFKSVNGLRRKIGVFIILLFRDLSFHICFLLLLLQLILLTLPKSITEPNGKSFSESWKLALDIQGIIAFSMMGLLLFSIFVSLLVVRSEYTSVPQAAFYTFMFTFLNFLNMYLALQSQVAESLKEDKWIVTPRGRKNESSSEKAAIKIEIENDQGLKSILTPASVVSEKRPIPVAPPLPPPSYEY